MGKGNDPIMKIWTLRGMRQEVAPAKSFYRKPKYPKPSTPKAKVKIPIIPQTIYSTTFLLQSGKT